MDDERSEGMVSFHPIEHDRNGGEKTELLLLLFSLDGFCGQERKKAHNGIHESA